jgi:hypothetical protein
MKNMTKRDIADIVLAVVGFVFILRLFQSIVHIVGILSVPDDDYNKFLMLQLYLINLLVLFIVSYLLLFKRYKVINLLFPYADKTKLTMGKEFVDFSKYIFWIKLVGMIEFLFSGTRFIAYLVSSVPIKGEFVIGFYWWHKSGPELIAAILGIIVIWRAEWIARFIEEIG